MRRFTLCITSFALVLSLVVVTAVPAYADDSIQVQDGYNVEDVPYNEAFEGVLTVSDSGSQLYSSSSNSTYSTPALLSAPDANTSNVIYSYKSVTGFIPTNIWRGSNSPAVTFPISNGYTAVKYVWSENDSSQSYYHFNSMNAFSKLQGGRRYRVTFRANFTRSSGSFVFYLANQKTPDTVLVSLLDIAKTINLSNSSKSVSIDFTLPEGASNVVPVIKGTLYKSGDSTFSSTELTFYVNDFTITDITTEDLDKSLDKFGDRIDSIINPSEPYSSFDDGSFENSADELKDAESALPTVDYDAFQNLANSIDLSEYSNAFAAINNLFIRFVDTVGITPLIFFALFFGICIFILGRKLSGG